MSVKLIKCSLPDDWEMTFDTLDDAVTELRRHICESCLMGTQGFGDEYEALDLPTIDVIHDGVRYECRDALTLLGTSCGCEYEMDGDVPWLQDEFESGNAAWAASFAT